MTTLQIAALLFFAVAVLATKGKDIFAWLKSKLPTPVPAPVPPQPLPEKHEVVADLMTVSELRERLTSENCKEGVDACSKLLGVLIDHKHPHVGAKK